MLKYIYIYIYFTFTLLLFIYLFFLAFILLSPCLSPHYLSISSFFLHRPIDPSFFLHRSIADLHEPSHHRPIVIDPCSAADLTHFSLSSLFLAFRLCVLGCAHVSGLCFGLCLCFRHGFWFLFRAVIFLLSFFVLH